MELEVSILARPDGRAQRLPTLRVPARGWLFQSSPALMDGRNPCAQPIRARCSFVSILARPDGRAQLPALMLESILIVVFQSSPALMDGRNIKWLSWVWERIPMFQSSPALMDGRNNRARRRSTTIHNVSILARPDGRAQPASWCRLSSWCP